MIVFKKRKITDFMFIEIANNLNMILTKLLWVKLILEMQYTNYDWYKHHAIFSLLKIEIIRSSLTMFAYKIGDCTLFKLAIKD